MIEIKRNIKNFIKVFFLCILLCVVFQPIYLKEFIKKECPVIKESNKNNNVEVSAEKNLMTIEHKNFSNYSNCCGAIIIGGGPGGLMCATYAARLGIPSTTIIMGEEPGGALMKTGVVENWPGVVGLEGSRLIEASIKQSKLSGANIIYEYVKEIDVTQWPFKVITNKNVYYGFTILLATGSNIKKLNCKGESEYWGKGVSPCAICDAPLHKNRSVLVVGGGDTACEEALQLSVHASKVYILVRTDKMRASKAMQERVKTDSKITILYNTQLQEVIGNVNEVTDALLVSNDMSIKFSQLYPQEQLSGVFIAIGQTPNIQLLEHVVDIDEKGLIKCIDRTQETSLPGIFVAGDVANRYKQAVIAAGEGATAAIEMFELLQKIGINAAFVAANKFIWLQQEKSEEMLSCAADGICAIPEKIINSAQNQNKESITLKNIKTEKEYRELQKKHKNDYYIIEFYGNYCPACTVMKSALEKYIKNDNSFPVYLIDVEKLPSLGKSFNIKSIPVIVIMKGEKIISKRIGSMSAKDVQDWIKKNI